MSRLPNQTQESRNNRWACTLIAMSSFNLIALVSVCGGEVVRFTGDENNGAPIHQSFSNNRGGPSGSCTKAETDEEECSVVLLHCCSDVFSALLTQTASSTIPFSQTCCEHAHGSRIIYASVKIPYLRRYCFQQRSEEREEECQ